MDEGDEFELVDKPIDDVKLNFVEGMDIHFNYNHLKFWILRACIAIEKKGEVVNSISLSKELSSKFINKKNSIRTTLNNMSRRTERFPNNYLIKDIDQKHTNGCIIKYKITEKGLQVYERLNSRYNRKIHDLNLKHFQFGDVSFPKKKIKKDVDKKKTRNSKKKDEKARFQEMVRKDLEKDREQDRIKLETKKNQIESPDSYIDLSL